MDIIIEWISKNKRKALILIILVIVLPMIAIQVLFNIQVSYKWLVAVWGPGELLDYLGNIIAFLGTILLGYIAIVQAENANKLSKSIVELEWKRQQPCLDIVNSQEYNIYISPEEIEMVLNKWKSVDSLKIELCYALPNSTISKTEVAVMEICIINTGKSDIRNIFIEDSNCYLSINEPDSLDRCKPYAVMGNHYIKAGEEKKLLIEFTQEIDIEKQEETSWIEEGKRHIMPSFNFDFIIVSSDGTEYKENLVLNSGWEFKKDREGEIKRYLYTEYLSVKKA